MLATHVNPLRPCDCMHMPVCIAKCHVSVLSQPGHSADCSSVEANTQQDNNTTADQAHLPLDHRGGCYLDYIYGLLFFVHDVSIPKFLQIPILEINGVPIMMLEIY